MTKASLALGALTLLPLRVERVGERLHLADDLVDPLDLLAERVERVEVQLVGLTPRQLEQAVHARQRVCDLVRHAGYRHAPPDHAGVAAEAPQPERVAEPPPRPGPAGARRR